MADLYWPFSTSRVSEWAGSPRPGGPHMGTDFAVAHGTPCPATSVATVVWTGDDGLGAWCIDLRRSDGLIQRFGHLSRIDVSAGQSVVPGQIIGLTGGTPGTPGAGMSTGAHLHWELRWDRLWNGGNWINPRTMSPAPKNLSAYQPDPQEITVKSYRRENRTARPIAPGQRLYLIDGGNAKENCVGGNGPYSLTAHIYGNGFAPGDVLEFRYESVTVATGNQSDHYLERVSADVNGGIRASREFKLDVPVGNRVHFSVYAATTNAKTGSMIVIDSDAYLFVGA